MAKSILITGASSGIGQATALHLLDQGWNVGLLGRRTEKLKELAEGRENALVITADVANEFDVKAGFAAFTSRFGRLDVLFNNAGIFTTSRVFDEITTKDWQRSVDINLTGSFLCARTAFSIMRAQSPQGGRIINNGSISAHTPRANSAPYTATKHAMTGLTKSISLDGRPFDIVCGQIDIGNAGTDMVANLSAKAIAANPNAKPDPVMDVAHVAQAVHQMADLPLKSNVLFMTIMASEMEFVGRG